jgi:ArsR family transcriptional regulator
MSEMLLRLLPPLDIADLGAGEATLSLMLAQRAKSVIAVDSSEKMVEFGRSVAQKNGVGNLDYRRGDLEDLPIEPAEVDLVLMHQVLHHALHPSTAMAEAYRILRPTGRIVVLDLLKHEVEAAKEMYADVWLGFSQVELIDLMCKTGFERAETSIVFREVESPHFHTVLAVAQKPG